MEASNISTRENIKIFNKNLIFHLQKNSTLIILLILWIALTFASPYFLTKDNVLNILLQSSTLAIMAFAVCMAVISGCMDLSVGAVEALSGSVAAIAMVNLGLPWWLASLGGIVSGLISGMISGFFIAHINMPAFVATLGMQGVARGLALVFTNGRAVYGLQPAFQFIGQGKIGDVPFPIFIMLFAGIFCWFILTKTKFGSNIYATGSNQEAARLSGINPKKIKMATMAISGAFAALAGLVLASRLNSGNGTVGMNDGLDVVAAIVIGGTSLSGGVGTIWGTLIGVLLVSTIRNGLNILSVSSFWQQVAIGALILGAVFLDYVTKSKKRN